MSTINYLVFVYGTLKQGFYNNRCLNDSRFIGEALTEKKYGMKDLGAFPGVDIDSVVSHIHGEVFEVTHETLQESLDHLEGYPNFYDRSPVSVTLNGEIEQVWMYFLNNPKDYSNQFIIDGIWRQDNWDRSRVIENPESRINNFVIGGRCETA